ncbi:membrane-bound ClpP family serine protease [Streptomyces sp. V3I7]|nr:membrane-bound ClpP family serine protease [Streptomyces sp. V3I7]
MWTCHDLVDGRSDGLFVSVVLPCLEETMIILGIILLVVGFVTGIGVLWTIGIILLVIGLILWILGLIGHAVGGRRHYW